MQPHNHQTHEPHGIALENGHDTHTTDHDKHAGHSPAMFKHRFWICLSLSIPALVFSNTVQEWLHLHFAFTGSMYVPALFGILIFFYGGSVFLKSARAELANRQPGMMTLVSMAIVVAFGYSLAVTLGAVHGMDFWWELATLVTIMLLGHWLEMASVMKAEGALHELAKLLPDQAERITANGTEIVDVNDLSVSDIVLVRPGTNIPADGVVVKGASDVNESMLTGESTPVKKSASSAVVAGTMNGRGSLTVRVSKVGSDTALAGIMKLVADAQQSKSKTQILADRAAFYLTFIALGAALITTLAWALWSTESTGFILERVVTVLVIACPHALGLAIPLVTAISTSLAARKGILVRQRMALEAARNVDVIVFDKTGTLTEGRLGVIDIMGEGDTESLLSLAAAVELESEHPIARAIVIAAKDRRVGVPSASAFLALAGRGAQANVAGKTVYVGGPHLIKTLHITIPKTFKRFAEQASKEGKTVVYVVTDSSIRGVITMADRIRPESKEAVDNLRQMNMRVAMLTGDNQGVATWVAHELGITEYFAEILPEHKAEVIRQLQSNGSRVAMVGDGVNDAPALAQATIGIAIGAGADVAIEAAGIVLGTSDPRSVSKVVTLSRATYRKMVQNLMWATGYNAIALPLAAGITFRFGFVLSPAFGAVLMSLSTIIVALNAQLLRAAKLDR